MKHNILHISTLLWAGLLLTISCTREELVPDPAAELVPLAEFQIGYQLNAADVYTKAGQDIETENTVRNLYVLLFAEDGHLVHSRRYLVTMAEDLTPEQSNSYDSVLRSYHTREDENSDFSSGIIPGFFTDYQYEEGELDGNLTFYAVANYSTMVDQDLDALANDGTSAETKLHNLTIDITPGSVERNYFFMVAESDNINLNPVVDGTGIKVERIGTNLPLRRLDAKITFYIEIDIDGASEISFDNPTYRVHRIPNMSYLFERSKTEGTGQNTWDAAQNTESDFSCMDDDNFEHFDSFDGTSGFFAFYMRENRPLPKKKINQQALEEENNNGKNYENLYVLREAWQYDVDNADQSSGKTPVHERDFTYAPENSTFVEISGNLNYTRKRLNSETQQYEDEYVSGYVTYIVHLGETGNDVDNVEAVNNYDVRRNVRYIYNMKITGISSFELEVGTDGKEKRPGAEGDLSISNSQQFTLDSHYGRILLELDKDDILRNAQQAGWNVSTPLGTTTFDGSSISFPYDYKWILFAINKEFGQSDDKMVKFPGTQAYDGGIRFHDKEEDYQEQLKSDTGNKIILDDGTTISFKKYLDRGYDRDNYYYSNSGSSIDEDACLRDINQLLRHLYDEASNGDLFGDESKIAITAFCDEYTYLYDPRYEDYIHPGTPTKIQEDLLLWKEYVNTDDRVLNITPMVATDYSEDKNTSITHSFVSISQMAIKTIYNEHDPDLKTAWGLETTNETGKLTYNIQNSLNLGSKQNTSSDGRTNFLNFWLTTDRRGNYNGGNIDWTKVMTVDQRVEDANGLQADYRDAFHACITRNRDLNGNNKIDENEIYWYLAAKDQLSGLYIGQPALEENAWMYTGNGSETNHLITSSFYYNGYYESTNFWILWSEEGASWGKLRGGGDDKSDIYDYRCIRNLGIPIDEYTDPTHYAKISGEQYDSESRRTYQTIDVSVVNSRALRSEPVEGFLPLGNERSQNNQPFRRFDVLTSNYGSGITWTEMRDKIRNNDNSGICPEGWRPPNQREFLIMMSLINLTGNLGVATTFSFNGTGLYTSSNRYGFLYTAPNLRLYNDVKGPNGDDTSETKLFFRCVRDNPDN